MDAKADCFVAGAVAVFLRVSRVAGVAPLHFIKERSGWRVSVSPALSFYGYVVVIVSILLTFGTLLSDLNLEQKHSVRMKTNTRRVVWVTDSFLMMLIAGTIVYGAPGQMRSMIRYFNHLQKINHELSILQWPMFHEGIKITICIVWLIITIGLACMDLVFLTFFDTTDSVQSSISMMYSFYYICYWIMQLRKMQFILTTLHLLFTFKAINENLKNVLHVTDFKKYPLLIPFKEVNKTKTYLNNIVVSSVSAWEKTKADGVPKPPEAHHQTVRRLALVYAATCDVLREVDRCYGLVLLMLLGAFLLHLVCTPYYLITNIFEDSTSESPLSYLIHLMIQSSWCIYHACNLLMVVEPCHLTHVEMENTRELVGHLTRCTHSPYDPLAVELELFFRHLVLNQASYSPLKVTTMSRALIATILGSITSYLVIITQL